jgi:hypothetical protein
MALGRTTATQEAKVGQNRAESSVIQREPGQGIALLKQPMTNAHTQSRGHGSLDASFHFDTGHSHAHWMAHLRRLTDQPHNSRLWRILPLELHC